MNSLQFKRNYKFLLFFILFLGVSIAFGNTRIISYNFGEYFTEVEVSENNIENSLDILDDSFVHEIELEITDKDYENLVIFYRENNEKEYLKTNITIDGVAIRDVGIKLKGNKVIFEDIESINIEEIDFSFFVKFDEYIPGQKYQEKSEIALISGNVTELQGEYIAGEVFKKYGVIAPKTSFTSVSNTDGDVGTYLVKEVVNEDFLVRYFSDTKGLLYKAENSFSFRYLGEDPTKYSDLFTQETRINNYDLKKIIEILEFVSESGSTKFLDEFTKYIDIENYTKYLAITDILYGENDKISLLNSYYIYYNLETETIQFIPWDEEYISNFEQTSLYSVLENIFSKQEIVDLSKRDIREILDKYSDTEYETLKGKYVNDLENNFLDDAGFKNLFESVQGEILKSLENENYINTLEEKIATFLL